MIFFLYVLFSITCSITSLNAMNHTKPIKAQLTIGKKLISAAYPSQELTQSIHEAGIPINPFDIVINVETSPAVEGMPSYLPVKEIKLCKTGAVLPYLLHGKQEVLLTCTDSNNVPFEQMVQTFICVFNACPNYAYKTKMLEEYKNLTADLKANNLIEIKQFRISGTINQRIPVHSKYFQPHVTPKKHRLVNRQRIGIKK